GDIALGFPGPLLGRGQFIVEDNTIRPRLPCRVHQLDGFSRTGEVALAPCPDKDTFPGEDRDPESRDQFAELFEEAPGSGFVGSVKIRTNEKGALHQTWFFAGVEHQARSDLSVAKSFSSAFNRAGVADGSLWQGIRR